MKKLYFSFALLSLVVYAPVTFAQQQINNDGITINELQPQTQSVQNNASNQQAVAKDINENIGNSEVLKNANVEVLDVTGAPANTAPEQQPNRGFSSWIILGSGILLVLIGPALLYARDIKRKGTLKPYVAKDKFPTQKSLEKAILKDLEAAPMPQRPTRNPKSKSKKPKNKSKNKNKAKKSKR